MDYCHNFAESLEAIRQQKRETLYEFSQELDVSKSTLQDILKGGNTTLHTALHIATHLNVPLSTLTGEVIPVDKLNALMALLNYFGWFERLCAEDQRTVADHIRAIMEVLQK